MPSPEITAEVERLWQMPRHVETVTWLAGGDMSLADGPSFAAQFRSIVLDEAYAFPLREGRRPVIVDGGANVGLACRWWLSQWPEATIVALEPDPRIFDLLSANLAGAGPAVDLRRCALAGRQGTASFAQIGADAGRLADDDDVAAQLSVETLTLSSLLAEHERIDLVKLDIEGAEVEVLHEAEPLLGRVDRLFVEYHSRQGRRQYLGALLALLRRAGYRYYLETSRRSQRPFFGVSSEVGFDLLVDIWASREDDAGPRAGGREHRVYVEGSA